MQMDLADLGIRKCPVNGCSLQDTVRLHDPCKCSIPLHTPRGIFYMYLMFNAIGTAYEGSAEIIHPEYYF